MKKSIIAIVFLLSLISVNSVLGLGLTAGTVRIVVDVGSSNSSRFGLLNNENETVTVSLRVEGDVAEFIEIPEELELVPKKLTYVDVTATIPEDYDGSLDQEFLLELQKCSLLYFRQKIRHNLLE